MENETVLSKDDMASIGILSKCLIHICHEWSDEIIFTSLMNVLYNYYRNKIKDKGVELQIFSDLIESGLFRRKNVDREDNEAFPDYLKKFE